MHSLINMIHISSVIEQSLCYKSTHPFTDSKVPLIVPYEQYAQYLKELDDITLDYVNKTIETKKIALNQQQLLVLIYQRQLEPFLDRMFTDLEGSVCSHDKTLFAIHQLTQAILTQQPLNLHEKFDTPDKPELHGKRAYWSIDTFDTTDELISVLTEKLYLNVIG